MSTGLRPQIAARVVQGGKSSNSCLRRALRPQTPCAGGPRPPHVRAVVENHDNSDCCGGVEAVGRLLVLDSPSFQMLCWIPRLLVFLVLDSTSFWLLCWIQPKKSCCAGFQLCCAGVQFSRPPDMTPEIHAQGRGSLVLTYSCLVFFLSHFCPFKSPSAVWWQTCGVTRQPGGT